jgi:signal peptidase II|tara:strand:- start:1837 stop:2283 length:447 start_codon:yes stop_codon:yes gene_type:complete
VVLFDQLSKSLVMASLDYGDRVSVLPFFSWVRWHNEGAAFSMFAGGGGWQRWLFIALAIGFSIFIVTELRRLSPGKWLMGLGYALIMGGALGNMVDRVRLEYVVDFVLVHYGSYYFPAFNVADAALSIGAALWLYATWREARLEKAGV